MSILRQNYKFLLILSCHAATVPLLAFAMHQIHQLTDKLFQELRSQHSRLSSLWEHMVAVINFFYFTSMQVLWNFMPQKKDYQPPAI